MLRCCRDGVRSGVEIKDGVGEMIGDEAGAIRGRLGLEIGVEPGSRGS